MAAINTFHLIANSLFHGHAFGKVSGLVHVAASSYGYVIGEELEGDYFEDWE
jgi:hypothetical protein